VSRAEVDDESGDQLRRLDAEELGVFDDQPPTVRNRSSHGGNNCNNLFAIRVVARTGSTAATRWLLLQPSRRRVTRRRDDESSFSRNRRRIVVAPTASCSARVDLPKPPGASRTITRDCAQRDAGARSAPAALDLLALPPAPESTLRAPLTAPLHPADSGASDTCHDQDMWCALAPAPVRGRVNRCIRRDLLRRRPASRYVAWSGPCALLEDRCWRREESVS